MPDRPTVGPCQEGAVPCRVGPHHWRERKTGPEFPLLVMRCRSHQLGFTLYPPGHVPYGRRAIAPVAPDGPPLDVVRVPEAFRATLFEAALDAAEGRQWPRSWERLEDEPDLNPESTTQWRWVRRAARLVGVDPDLSEQVRHTVATALGVPMLVLTEQGSRTTRSMGTWAAAIVTILAQLVVPATRLPGLLRSGALVELWAAPLRWDPEAEVLRSLVARPGGTRAPP